MGTFAFTEPSTAPDVGAAFHPVALSPVDSANYNSVTGAISVTVGKAASTISAWPSASAIYRGEPLSKSILSGGSASVAGSFAFLSPTDTPPVGTASHAVRFTPEDTTHYLAADGMVAVVVVSALEIEEVPEPVEASAGASFGAAPCSANICSHRLSRAGSSSELATISMEPSSSSLSSMPRASSV